jgi:NTE family protein
MMKFRSPRREARMKSAKHDDCILVLQGGGALGSYQAGAFEALAAEGMEPDWVAGISIGAMNCALIAGNAPAHRVGHLREFWDLVSSALPEPPFRTHGAQRAAMNDLSSSNAIFFGVPGFFRPWIPPAPFQPPGTPPAVSYYDTDPLRRTLERLVDFDRLNDGAIRFCVGAVNVRTGNVAWFDSAKQRIDVRHVMASGALPPGFPPVEIDGEHYWDGGLVTNTPLQRVLEEPGLGHRTVFQVDLFPAVGALPQTLGQVGEREKDIRFSSRTRFNTKVEVKARRSAKALQRLVRKLPPKLRDDPDVQELLRETHGSCPSLDIVHLIYRAKAYEDESKDYEFSRWTMREHWENGRADVRQTLHDPRWTRREPAAFGVREFDLVDPARRAVVLEARKPRRARAAASVA